MSVIQGTGNYNNISNTSYPYYHFNTIVPPVKTKSIKSLNLPQQRNIRVISHPEISQGIPFSDSIKQNIALQYAADSQKEQYEKIGYVPHPKVQGVHSISFSGKGQNKQKQGFSTETHATQTEKMVDSPGSPNLRPTPQKQVSSPIESVKSELVSIKSEGSIKFGSFQFSTPLSKTPSQTPIKGPFDSSDKTSRTPVSSSRNVGDSGSNYHPSTSSEEVSNYVPPAKRMFARMTKERKKAIEKMSVESTAGSGNKFQSTRRKETGSMPSISNSFQILDEEEN